MKTVQTYLEVNLEEAKSWLRLNDDLEATLTLATVAGGTVHKISDLSGLRAGRWVTVAGIDCKITYVDYMESNIVVDRPVSINPLTEGTPVTFHHQNGLIQTSIQAAKGKADEYLNNSFSTTVLAGGVLTTVVSIPPEVKEWVLTVVALMYEKPEATLVSDSLREIGSRRFENDLFYSGIQHLRMYPL